MAPKVMGSKISLGLRGARTSSLSKDMSMRLMPVRIEQRWPSVIWLDLDQCIHGWLSREDAGMSWVWPTMIEDGLLDGLSSLSSLELSRTWHLQFGFSAVEGELPLREDGS